MEVLLVCHGEMDRKVFQDRDVVMQGMEECMEWAWPDGVAFGD